MFANARVPSKAFSRNATSVGLVDAPSPVTRTAPRQSDLQPPLGATCQHGDRVCADRRTSELPQAATARALAPPSGATVARCRALSCDILYCDQDTGRPYRTQSLPYVNLDKVDMNEREISPGKYLEKEAVLRAEIANDMQVEVEYNLLRTYELRPQEAAVMRVAVTKDGTTCRHAVSTLGRGSLDDKIEVRGGLTDPKNPDKGSVTIVVNCGVHERAAT